MRAIAIITASLILINLSACKKDPTGTGTKTPEVQLSIADIGVTETWLNTHISGILNDAQLTLVRNDSLIQTIYLPDMDNSDVLDTLLYDNGLQPAKDYTYMVTVTTKNNNVDAMVQLTTMDTTSHNFTWQTWSFGAKGSSVLYDVAIINENDIWAVGEIYTENSYTYDSLGNWIDPYNAVHWNGTEWELKRILYKDGFWDIKAVYAFDENNVWFESYVRWSGTNFIEMPVDQVFKVKRITKMWGTSSDDMYVVGNEGLIAHYNGLDWQRIETGTDNIINDIYGIGDTAIATVSDKYDFGEFKILIIDGLIVDDKNLIWPYSNKPPYSVWFNNNNKIWVCGAGLHYYINNAWIEYKSIPTSSFLNRVRGAQINDVYIAGDFGFLGHFNGKTWCDYSDYTSNGIFESLDYKNGIVVAVGYDYPKAKIKMGYKQ